MDCWKVLRTSGSLWLYLIILKAIVKFSNNILQIQKSFLCQLRKLLFYMSKLSFLSNLNLNLIFASVQDNFAWFLSMSASFLIILHQFKDFISLEFLHHFCFNFAAILLHIHSFCISLKILHHLNKVLRQFGIFASVRIFKWFLLQIS